MENLSISGISHVIGQALNDSCIIVLLLLLVATVWQFGDIIVEFIVERRKVKEDIPELLKRLNGMKPEQMKQEINNAKILKRQKKMLTEMIDAGETMEENARSASDGQTEDEWVDWDENAPSTAGTYEIRAEITSPNVEGTVTADMTLTVNKKPSSGGGGGSSVTTYGITTAQSDGGTVRTSASTFAPNGKLSRVMTFAPDRTMTRAMLITVLWRMENEPQYSGNSVYKDVRAGIWYENAVQWAAEKKIVNGTGDGRFMPDDAVTREQLMQIIRNYAEYKGINVSASAELKAFNDSSTISSWAEDAFKWGVATGMISGAGKNSLSPKDSATRAQVAKILTEFDKNIMMRA